MTGKKSGDLDWLAESGVRLRAHNDNLLWPLSDEFGPFIGFVPLLLSLFRDHLQGGKKRGR